MWKKIFKKIIWIAWWVGPIPGTELHKRIIENTDSGGTDQAQWDFNIIQLHALLFKTERIIKGFCPGVKSIVIIQVLNFVQIGLYSHVSSLS